MIMTDKGEKMASAENGKSTPPLNETSPHIKSTIPMNRQSVLKWNGWGYNDSKFEYRPITDQLYFTGKRYAIGEMRLPHMIEWVRTTFNVNLAHAQRAQPHPTQFPRTRLPAATLSALQRANIGSISLDGMDRLIRAHGQTLDDIYRLRYGKFDRIPDAVIWPRSHQNVIDIVQIAYDTDTVIIPYGGGTAVSGAVQCPALEPRPIISLDMTQMNRILWVDAVNLTACCEAGIVGQDLERHLRRTGHTSGHEPDSYEFSTLGGWVATRASGMKKNVYGNIEDLVVHVKMVTGTGRILTRTTLAPRISAGPDFQHVILGSEGTLGVVTEVVLKIRPVPRVRRFGSVIFPHFDAGVQCMRQVALHRCQPASIRLMDNGQFKFGMILKPDTKNFLTYVTDALKKIYVTHWKRFSVDEMCVMTLLFECDDTENAVKTHEQLIYTIAAKFGGLPAGQMNGERGYMLTFIIAYVRDLALEYNVVAESFETSVPWSGVCVLCRNVKYAIGQCCEREKIRFYMINCRVTQTYDAGCVVYFYLAFNYGKLPDPVQIHERIEHVARDEVLACGGSISHHHGVGKLRRKWYPTTVSDMGVDLFKATKKCLDPKNLFATGNFLPYSKL